MNYNQDKYFIAIADLFKAYLENENIDAAELAAAANVDRKQVYRLINKENIPKLSTLVRIILAAGMKPAELFSMKFDFETYMRDNNILIAASKKEGN